MLRPSARCPAPRYQEGSTLVTRRVLVTDTSQIVDARASPAPTRWSGRPTRAVSLSRDRTRSSTAARPATTDSAISQVERNHAVRCAEAVRTASGTDSPQVDSRGGLTTPVTKHRPDRMNRTPMARSRIQVTSQGPVMARLMRSNGSSARRHACSTEAGDPAANRQKATSSSGMERVRRRLTAVPSSTPRPLNGELARGYEASWTPRPVVPQAGPDAAGPRPGPPLTTSSRLICF